MALFIYIKAKVVRDFYKLCNLPPTSLELLHLQLYTKPSLHQETCSLLALNVSDWETKRAADASRRFTPSPQRSPPNPSLPPGFYPPYLTTRMSCKSPISPPGFSHPQYPTTPAPIKVPYDLPLQANTALMSPYSVNVSRLTATFGDTDILDNFGERSANLRRLDPDGQLDLSKNGDCFANYKSCDQASSPFDDPQRGLLVRSWPFGV